MPRLPVLRSLVLSHLLAIWLRGFAYARGYEPTSRLTTTEDLYVQTPSGLTFGRGRHMGSNSIVWLLGFLLSTRLFVVAECEGEDPRLPPNQQTCDVQPCWSLYEQASDHYQADAPGVADKELRHCIVLRTYKACLSDYFKRFSAACAGDINFRTALKYSDTNMARHNCSATGPVYPDGPAPPGGIVGGSSSDRQPCAFIGRPSYRLCSLFGDPHLHGFNGDCQTCKLVGAWPLIDNKFLTVQVSNELVAGDSMATATTKLTIIVHASKEQSRCIASEAMFYTAENGNLPSSFDDGSSETAGSSVALTVVSPGERVDIHLRYIDTRVVVRLTGAYLSVAIVMPEEVVNATADSRGGSDATLQLCHAGCPAKERISFAQFFRVAAASELAAAGGAVGTGGAGGGSSSAAAVRRTLSRQQAASRCREAGVADFYFDSCVFDLLKTGDLNFTVMAQRAFVEAQRFRRAAAAPATNRTDLAVYESRSRRPPLLPPSVGSSAPGGRTVPWLLCTVCCGLACLVVYRARGVKR